MAIEKIKVPAIQPEHSTESKILFGVWLASVIQSAQESADKDGKTYIIYIDFDRNFAYSSFDYFYNTLNARPVKIAHIYPN